MLVRNCDFVLVERLPYECTSERATNKPLKVVLFFCSLVSSFYRSQGLALERVLNLL